MLEEGGYVTSEEIDGKKVYTITDVGRKLLKERGEKPFEATPGMTQAFEVQKSLAKLGVAVVDGIRGTDPKTMKRIRRSSTSPARCLFRAGRIVIKPEDTVLAGLVRSESQFPQKYYPGSRSP